MLLTKPKLIGILTHGTGVRLLVLGGKATSVSPPNGGSINGHHGRRGDDDVDIAITSDGDTTTVNVAYRNN